MAVAESPTAAPEQGLRERKKQRTRELIAETARRLFSERGFEQVSVAEIAQAAEVSQQTVFNYFPTKEDLVYWRLGSFEEELLEAIRGRETGTSALSAFGEFLLGRRGLLGRPDREAREQLAAMARMITGSPALLAREREIFARYTDSLAALLAAEQDAGDADVLPRVVANAMIGVHHALVDYSRQRVLAGVPQPRIAREVRAEAERLLGTLEQGLGEYARR
jgi:AcrR family transcriptional regulator